MPQIFAGSAHYPTDTPAPVVTIGNFDGVHCGHRHLIDRLLATAADLGAPACVYTFEPPPRVLLAPHLRQPRIMPWTEKLRLLGEAGVQQVVVERFTRAFAQHPPDWFVHQILQRRLRAQALVVGYDFRFGRKRMGDVDFLRREAPELPVDQVQPHSLQGQESEDVISSSRIRRLVAEGDVALAAALLGRPHGLSGTVIEGSQIGRTIGFPTANIASDDELLPAPGVYAVRARIDQDGPWRPGIANLGTRPTFNKSDFLIEVHLLDFQGDLYGREVQVGFVERLRDEQRFDNAEALTVQLRADADAARRLLQPPAPRA